MWTLAQARSSLVSRGAQHVPTLENGAPGTAIVVHIHLTGLGVLVDQVRHAVAVKVGGPHYPPAACVEATTEAGPTNESGSTRAAVIVHIHLIGLRVLVDQIRRDVAVKVGSRLNLPVGGVDATTEAGSLAVHYAKFKKHNKENPQKKQKRRKTHESKKKNNRRRRKKKTRPTSAHA